MDYFYYNHYAGGLTCCPGENFICPRCAGHGYHNPYDVCIYSFDEDDFDRCYICKGLGHIDWITNVTETGWEKDEIKFLKAQGVWEDKHKHI